MAEQQYSRVVIRSRAPRVRVLVGAAAKALAITLAATVANAQDSRQRFNDYVSGLGTSSSLGPTDGVPIVQGGQTKKWLPYNYFLNRDASNVSSASLARKNLGTPYNGILWTTLGVVDDGSTDNTAVLNALPTGVQIDANCPTTGIVRVNSPWLWQSNLNIKARPECRVVSYVSGNGSYAITQADITTPLNNVTIDGLKVSKSATVHGERILQAYINHLKLLNWTFSEHAGVMFIRGSCQEIAYGSGVSTDLTPGSAGIRHFGNVPKVVDACDQPADVWVHDNVVISGDAAYQSCQPNLAEWANVSSDDMLWENNRGIGSAFALIGNDQVGAFNAYTCNKIVYRNNYGTGRHRALLVASNGAPVTNVTYASQDFDMIDSDSNNAAVFVRGADTATGGIFANLVFDNINIYNTNVKGLEIDVRAGIGGSLDGFVFRGGTIDSPLNAFSGGALWQPNITINGGNNVSLINNVIHGAGVGADATIMAGYDDGASDALTVTNLTLSGNLIDQVPANSIGVSLKNVANADVMSNVIRRASGAATVTGIKLWPSYALPTSGTGPGSTATTLKGNVVKDLATPINWTCNSVTTNFATANHGDPGRICP